jgi:hypothetical protein
VNALRGLAIGGIAVALAILAACDAVRPLSTVCEARLKPTEIHVIAAPVEYTTDTTVSSEELTKMGNAGSGRVVHGITHTNMRSSVTLGSNGMTNHLTGKHCLRPIIDVKLAFEPMVVYVSKEQQPGSCQFSTTMQHELQHVAVYRDFLTTAAEEIETKLRTDFGSRIFYFDSEADAQAGIQTQTSERVGPFVEQAMRLVEDKQAPLDTRAEYDRLERLCGFPP